MLFLFYSTLQLFFLSFAFIFFGTTLIMQNPFLLTVLLFLIGVPYLLKGVYYVILVFFTKGPSKARFLIISTIDLLFGIFLIIWPQITFSIIFSFVFIYLFFIASVKGIDCYVNIRNRSKNFFLSFLSYVLLIFALVISLIFFHCDKDIIIRTFGVFLLFFGLLYVSDFIQYIIPHKKKSSLLWNTKFALPDAIALFLPSKLLSWRRNQKLLKLERIAPFENSSVLPNTTPDVEIIFHITPFGIGIAGHCEICYQGKTFTYGNYDYSSSILLRTGGDGIIFRADRDKYIDWSVNTNKKTIIAFGLKLSEEEKQNFDKAFNSISKDLEAWKTAYETDEVKKDITKYDYISKVFYLTNASVYRFKKGPFKTYFMPTINCVSITNYVFKKAKINNLLLYGIKTPGAYFDFIQKEYLSKKSVIISRTIYEKK